MVCGVRAYRCIRAREHAHRPSHRPSGLCGAMHTHVQHHAGGTGALARRRTRPQVCMQTCARPHQHCPSHLSPCYCVYQCTRRGVMMSHCNASKRVLTHIPRDPKTVCACTHRGMCVMHLRTASFVSSAVQEGSTTSRCVPALASWSGAWSRTCAIVCKLRQGRNGALGDVS